MKDSPGSLLAVNAIDNALKLFNQYRKGFISKFQIKPSALYEILAVYTMLWAAFQPEDDEKKLAYRDMVDVICEYIQKEQRDPNDFLRVLQARIVEVPLHAGESDYEALSSIARSLVRRMNLGNPNDHSIVSEVLLNLINYRNTMEEKWDFLQKC